MGSIIVQGTVDSFFEQQRRAMAFLYMRVSPSDQPSHVSPRIAASTKRSLRAGRDRNGGQDGSRFTALRLTTSSESCAGLD